MTEAEEKLQALAEGLGLEGETLALIQHLSPDQCRKLGAREKENSYNYLVGRTTMAKILSLSKPYGDSRKNPMHPCSQLSQI